LENAKINHGFINLSKLQKCMSDPSLRGIHTYREIIYERPPPILPKNPKKWKKNF